MFECSHSLRTNRPTHLRVGSGREDSGLHRTVVWLSLECLVVAVVGGSSQTGPEWVRYVGLDRNH